MLTSLKAKVSSKRWVKARKKDGRWLFDLAVVRAHENGWIGIREASYLTGYSESHLRWLAGDGQVMAEMVNGFWLLDRESLLDYCRRRGRI